MSKKRLDKIESYLKTCVPHFNVCRGKRPQGEFLQREANYVREMIIEDISRYCYVKSLPEEIVEVLRISSENFYNPVIFLEEPSVSMYGIQWHHRKSRYPNKGTVSNMVEVVWTDIGKDQPYMESVRPFDQYYASSTEDLINFLESPSEESVYVNDLIIPIENKSVFEVVNEYLKYDRIKNTLSSYSGIGEKTILDVYEKYNSIEKVKKSSAEELAKIDYITKENAEKIVS